MKPAVALAVTTVVALAGCSNDKTNGQTAATMEQAAVDGPTSVHSLVLQNDELLIGTHDGLWKHIEGQTQAEPIGDSRRDVMALTALGNRLLSSGHPDPRDRKGQQSNVGIIESLDQGKSWQRVALAGKVDIHAIAAAAKTVYGYDIVKNRLLGSDDIGRTWRTIQGVTSVTSLAISPTNTSHVLAGTDQGVKQTTDAGRSWQPASGLNGIVAFGRRNAWSIDRRGRVRRADPSGARWQTIGSVPGPPAAITATTNGLIVALEDGRIVQSVDNGETFSTRLAP